MHKEKQAGDLNKATTVTTESGYLSPVMKGPSCYRIMIVEVASSTDLYRKQEERGQVEVKES